MINKHVKKATMQQKTKTIAASLQSRAANKNQTLKYGFSKIGKVLLLITFHNSHKTQLSSNKWYQSFVNLVDD